MLSSLRARLLVVTLLAAIGMIGAIAGLTQVALTSTQVRVTRAHETVAGELERLVQMWERAPVPETRRRGRRDFGALKSGFLDSDLKDESAPPPFGPVPLAARADVAHAAKSSGTMVIREGVTGGDAPLVVGAVALPAGGYVWAAIAVGTPPIQQKMRAFVIGLALASVLLVLASVHTLVTFQRGARSLRGSLRALGRDLDKPVAKPRLRELGEIADGIEQLAFDLSAAQEQKEALTRELAERERLAALGRVAAGVAHEVRNPLAAIKLRADLALENKALDPQLARDLADISREVGRLNKFVQDLLVVSGRKAAERAPTDLGALAKKRAELLFPWARERGVSLEVRGDATADVEPDAIGRALDNLLRNAVEASPKDGTVEVVVARDGKEIALRVGDRGAGVPEDRRAQLFEPFFTTKPDGTGLGLALSRSVAASHGGTVRYEREGDLTWFTLTIRE